MGYLVRKDNHYLRNIRLFFEKKSFFSPFFFFFATILILFAKLMQIAIKIAHPREVLRMRIRTYYYSNFVQ